MRLAGDIFMGGSRRQHQDADPSKYTSDDYIRAINKGGTHNFGTKENRRRWIEGRDSDDGGYGGQLTDQGREQMAADKRNPLYQKVAQDAGIKNFDSANDMAQVIKHLSGKNGSSSDKSSGNWRKELERPEYIQAGKDLGLKALDSENDLRKIRAHLER